MTQQKNKTQLIQELEQAQKRIAELERAAVKKAPAKKPSASTRSKAGKPEWTEEEAFYQTFIDQSYDGIVIIDEQGNINTWNSAQEKITGLLSKEVYGQKYWDVQLRLLTPELRARLSPEKIKEALKETFKTGEYHSLRKIRDVEILSADGKRKFIQVSPFSVKTPRGYRIVSITRDVTEQKRAAEALHENEERFSRVFHVSPSQMAIADSRDGKYIDVNEVFLKTLGFAREEVIGKNASELDLFYDREQRAALLGKMQKQGYLREENVMVRTKTGGLRHGIFSAEFIQVDDHQFLLTVMNDITERKQAEEKLHSSEERHRSLIENMSEAVVEVDEQGRFCYISPNYFNLSGYTPEEELGSSIIAHVHPDDLPALLRALENHKELTLPQMTYRIRAKNGEWRWVEASGKPYRLANGDQRVISVLRDVTNRQVVEEKIKQSEARLKGFLDAAPDAMIIANTEGRIILANLQTENLFGYSQSELLQMEVEQLIPENLRGIHPSLRAEFTKNPVYALEGITREIHTLRKDGSEFPAEISLSLHKMGDETVVLGAVRDITERKKAEEDSQRNQAVLFETQKIAKLQTWVIDFQEKFIEVGPGYDQVSEWPEGKYKLKDLEQIIQPLDVGLVKMAWKQASSNNPLDIEFRVLLNKELRWVHVKAYDSEIDDEKLRGFSQDITKRKQAEALAYAQLNLARLVSTVTTDEEALPRCLDTVMEISGMDCGGIYLLDTDTNVLRLAYHKGLGADFVQKVSRYTSDTPSVQMVLAGMMFYFGEDELAGQTHNVNEGLRSLAVIPILDHGHVLGCINVGSHSLPYTPEASRQALETIAPEVGNIIAHLRTEMQLNEARERLLEAQAMAHIGNWEWDLKEQTLIWSDEVYRIFGVSPEDFTPTIESFENAIHPEDREDFLSRRANILEEKQEANIHHRIILPDGRIRHVQERTQVLLDETGGIERVIGTVQDITEGKLAEEALQKSTQILNESQAIANLGSWTADLRTGVFDATPEGARLVGWTPGLHSADELMDVIHPDDKEFMQTSWEAAMHGAPYDIEHRIILHGETRWLHITAKMTFDRNGAPLSALGVTQDITDRKKADEARRESDDRYRLLFETMVQGVVFQDSEGKIIHANSAAEKILGLTLEQMQGRASVDPRWRAIHEDGSDFPGEEHPAMVVLRTGEPIHNTLMGVFNPVTESHHWININSTPRFMMDSTKPYQVYTTFEDITGRKLAENALFANEKKLKSLIESQTHYVIRIDMEGKYVYWNPQFEKEFGWIHEPHGLLHADSMKTIVGYHRQNVIDVVQNCISQPGQTFSVEIDKPARDGSIRTTLWEFVCLTDERNQPSEVQCMGAEITAEKALRESEEKYRLLAENISDVIWIMDIETLRFSYISPSILQLRGYSVDEVMAQDMLESLTPDSAQYLMNILPERIAEFKHGTLKVHTDEISQPCKDGSIVWTETTTRFVNNFVTGHLEVYGVSRNITERKKGETAIHLIENRNTALIEHAPDGIALVDAKGVFMFASPSAYRMFGYGPEEIIGIQSREKVHPQDVHLVAGLRDKLLTEPQIPQTIEYRFLHKDGSYRWLESTYTNMFDEPSIEGIVINFRDITDRKLAAEVTRQQAEQLRLLYEASQRLNRTLDVQEIYQTICDFMEIIAPSDTLFISAFDADTQLITCKAYWMEKNWLDVSPIPSIPLEAEGKGTQSRVIRSGKSMLLNDYQTFMKTSQSIYYVNDETNEVTTEGPEDDEEDVTRSAMIVPLKSAGMVKGVIQVASYHLDAYTEDQLKLLEALSLHIASAEQNALLYTQLLSELNERKQMEEALRASNETAQDILNAATESVFLMDLDGTVIAANDTTAIRLGKQAGSLVGTNIYDSLPSDTAEVRKQRVASLIRDGKPLIFEDERFGVWIENSLYPIFDSEGKVRRIAIYGRDITNRKKMEDSLLKSEGLLMEAQRIGRIGHMEWNGKDKELICSTELYDILGLPHDAVLTQETIGQMMASEDISTLQQEDETSFRSHHDLNYQYRIHLADGSERWLHQIGKVTYGENGAPIRMMAVVQDITERKQTEDALRDSEARARAMLQAIPDLVFRLDKQGVFLDYKADARQFYAQSPDLPLIGKRNRDVTPTEFADLIEKEIEKTLETGTLQAFEYKLEIPEAGLRDYEARMTPSGKDEVLAIIRDVTEQNKARSDLRSSEEKYRVLIESLDNVVASVDREGRFLYMNDMAAGQMGSTAENLIGKTMNELFPEVSASRQMANIQKVLTEDRGIVTEGISIVQGMPRWYRTSIQPIHDEGGRPAQVLINSTDIHDLKTTQDELQELNRTLEERVQQRTAEVQDLYDNAPAGYHSLDANGNIILVNETELKWLGYSREELAGKPILNMLTPASVKIFKDNFPAFKQRGILKDLELEFIRKDGSLLPVLINATAVYDENKNYLLSRSTVMDNTEHKAADEALRHANTEMARAMRMKDEFLASMSHELRTPLNGILGLSEALQLDVYGAMTDKQRSTLVHIENSGRHLLELINDILDVSKIEAGKFELEMATCSLGDICQSSIQLTKGMAGKKQQNVNFTMNPASITLKADGRRLKQVLVNLLSNAVKFTPENGTLGLEVSEDTAEKIVYISVWDNGIGISNEDIKKLFQPFVQLDSSLSRQQTGTGLGLTLVQRLVEMHGGSIEVQSAPGQGSRFTVALSTQKADSRTETFEAGPQSKFHYALIIEDESMDAGHLARYCKALGINPILHSTGKDALQRTLAARPNIIFLDIHLPDLSGWEVLKQLKSHPETQHIPVVITSVDDEKQKAADLNADGYLVKLFTVSDMRTILTNLQKAPLPVETIDAPSGKPIATVMIVDDNEINIETVIDYLGSKNFNVLSALSGIDFLARAPQVRPDIVLMDIQMPEMDGLETIRRLRAMKDEKLASVPVIALTALAMPGDRELCIDAGADEYVTKPFRLKEIYEVIAQMLEDKKRTEQ